MDNESEAASERVLSQVSENVPMGNTDCASSADWNAALFTPVKLPMAASCAETTPVREMEAFVESQVRALGPMRASLEVSSTAEEALKMTEDLRSEDGHAAAQERLAMLLHAEKENAVLRQHIESLKDKELDLALESGKEEVRRQEQMQSEHQAAMAAAAREIEHLRTECMNLGGALESRRADDTAREETEQELLELLAIVQENVQLSKQVQDEVQRAGIDLQGGELSVRPGAKDVSPTDEVQDPKEMTGGFGAGCGAPDRTVAILAEGTHQTRQRPRPKSAGAVSESHWSKGTVVFTPALERASSGGVKVGEDLARSAEDLGRDPLVKKGHGRLTARIRELEAQLEEALSAQQVSSIPPLAEPTEEMRELLLVVSQVERMERHIEDLTKENHRLRVGPAQPSPRSHLDIGVTSPSSDVEQGVNTPPQNGFGAFLSGSEEGVKTPFRQRETGVNAFLEQGVNTDSKEEDAVQELREKVETLESELREAVRALSEKEETLVKSAKALAASEEEKARLGRKLEVLETELGTTHSLLEESEAARHSVSEGRDEGMADVMLTAQLEAAVQEAEGLRGQLADALGELAGVQEREEFAAQEAEKLREAEREVEMREKERADVAVRETERMREGLEKEVEQWAMRMEEEKGRVRDEMREQMEKQTVEMGIEIERLKEELERVENESETFQSEANKWAAEAERLMRELERAEKAREAVVEKAETLRGELEEGKRDSETEKERVRVLENEVKKLQDEIRMLIEKADKERSEWEEGLSVCVRAAEAQAEALTSANEEVKRDLEKTVESLESATAALASEREAMSNQVGLRERAGAEVERLQNELGQAANREAGLAQQLAACERALADCESALEIAEKESARFREDLAQAAGRAIRLSEQVGATESGRERAETELKRLREELAEARKVGGQLAETKEALFLAEAALGAAEERARGAEEEANRASTKLEIVREELERARKRVGGEQQRLESRLEKARTEWQEELDRLLTATEQRYSEGLETALAGAKLDWEQNTELLVTETRRECGWEAEGQLAALRKAFEERETRLEGLEVALQEKEMELEGLRQELQREKRKLEEAFAQRDELRGGLERSAGAVSELGETLGAERAERAELNEALKLERGKSGKLEKALELERGKSEKLEGALELERARAEKLEEVLELERAKLGQLEEALELEREKVGDLGRELTKLEEALELERAKNGEEVESVTALLEVARAQSREKEGEILEFVQQLDAAQSECAALTGRLQTAERQLEAGRKTVDSELDELQRQLDDALKLGEEALCGIEEKEEQLAGLRKQLAEVKAQLREVTSACDVAKEEADLSDARAVQMEREMSELRTQRQQAREELEVACRKGEEAEKRGDAARVELNTVRSEGKAVRIELENVQMELESVRIAFEAVEAELRSVRKELSDAEKQGAAVRSERDSVKEELAGVRVELDIVLGEIDTVRGEQGSVHSELESVRKDLDGVRNERDVIKDECEGLKNETRALEVALQEARRVLEGKEEGLRNVLEARKREAGASDESFGAAKSQWEREAKEMQAALAAAVEALSEKELEVAALSEKMRKMREKLSDSETALARRKDEGEGLGLSLGDLEASLAAAQEKLRAADETRAELESQIAMLCHVDGSKGRHVSAAELAAVEEELAATRRALEAREGIVKEVTRQLDTCQEESRGWEAKAASLEAELAEAQEGLTKGLRLWAVVLVAGLCAVVKERDPPERETEAGWADTGSRRDDGQADSDVRKKLAFRADVVQAEGGAPFEEGDPETGFGADTVAFETGGMAVPKFDKSFLLGVELGAQCAPKSQPKSFPRNESAGMQSPEDKERNAGGVKIAGILSPGKEVTSTPGDDVAAAQRMLSDLRQQSERLHLELAGLAVAEKESDRGRQADVSGPSEAEEADVERLQENDLRESLEGLLARLHGIQASLLQCLGPVSDEVVGQEMAPTSLLYTDSDCPAVATSFSRVLMALRDNTHLWTKVRDLPTVPSTLEKLHAASLRELETLVADNVTLQQELQRHARSPQLEETATKNATGTEGGSQGGEGSDRGARSEGLREGGVQRAEQFGGGAATDGGRALERNEKEGVRLAESGAGCHGRERDEEKYDVDDDVTGSVDLSSQPKSRESDIFEKLSSSERKPALAGLAAGARLTLGLTSAEKRGLEQGSSGFQRGLGRELPNAFESGVKIWGGDISARGGPKAWFNPVFVEEEGGQEGRRDSGEGGGLGLGAAIAEVVGDRDRLLKQNGRLVMELETLKSRFSVAEGELERARSALAAAAALASRLDLAYGQLVRELETVRKERDDLALTSAPTSVTSARLARTVRTPERAVRTGLPPIRTPGTTRAREEARKRGIEGGGGREDKRRRQDGNEGGENSGVGLRGGVDLGLQKGGAGEILELSLEERRAAALGMAAGVSEAEERRHLRSILERVLEEKRRIQASLSEQTAALELVTRQRRQDCKRAKRSEAECRLLTERLHEQGLRLEAVLREHADVCHRLGRKELAVAALQRHIKVVSKENRELHEFLRERENRIMTLEKHP